MLFARVNPTLHIQNFIRNLIKGHDETHFECATFNVIRSYAAMKLNYVLKN